LAESTGVLKLAAVAPERFFQMGIAEANMVDVAAGMATCGKIPFASTFAIFGTGRAWESFRNSVCYPALNVKLACTHSGLSVGEDGASHQALEDIAVMRAIPNVTVVVPADYAAAHAATIAVAEQRGPVYLRLGRPKIPAVYEDGKAPMTLGKGNVLREGNDVAILACGPLVSMAVDAAKLLEKDGRQATVIDMHTIKPLDEKLLLDVARRCRCVVTAEEHNIVGGLGGAVSEALSQHLPTPLERVGTRDTFGESGTHADLWKKYGLTPDAIAAAARKAMERK
ncbi:MAG: transketolase family protein, partial [Planctomycetes bacterium]|nr:transketolase family protein [Planctomycetota bacterium]